MLVLTRKPEEVITIGDDIRVKVIAIHDGKVKLGIEAPREVKVYRSEVYEQIQLQNAQAAKVTKSSVVKVAGLLGRKTSSASPQG